jgi:hypothetical protein
VADRKYWEIIARNLKKPGRSLGYVSAIDSEGRTIWIADAHRSDGKRYVVRANQKPTACLEFESAICAWRGIIVDKQARIFQNSTQFQNDLNSG